MVIFDNKEYTLKDLIPSSLHKDLAEDIVENSNTKDDLLIHYGMPRRSGRYPWGSGEDPYQHSSDFLARVDELRKNKFEFVDEDGKKYTGDTAIARSMGLTTTQLRTEIGLATSERRSILVAQIKSLKEDGKGASEIGRELGISEGTVRSMLNVKSEVRMEQAKKTASFLKEQVDKKGMVDIGTGVEQSLGISHEKLNQAVYMLQREGYEVFSGGIPQITNPGQQTTQKVLGKPGTQHKDIYRYDAVHSLEDYHSDDNGETFRKLQYPASMDSSRIKIILKDEIDSRTGLKGEDKDGYVEIRRGVPDLSLGNSKYAQVRILVDDTKYIKGMASYSDNVPKGYDIVVHSSKKSYDKALKGIKDDPDNPFGSLIKANGQSTYVDPKDGKTKLSLINKRAEEGDWSDWKDALPSQFLAKQSLSLAKKQLDLAKANKAEEYDAISKLTNPVVKKHLLQKFSDECDSAAVHLQAAALPGQKYHVIMPFPTIKDNEIYAPNYPNGTKLALIRYPHGGTFEIPIVTVNNKLEIPKQILGTDSVDAVGINNSVAARLSGADFDGDTVMCIPTHDSKGRVKVMSTPELPGLKGFNPTDAYGPETYEGRKVRIIEEDSKGDQTKQREMGKVTNLITDMTLAGANSKELAAAVRHSMVIVDAQKHKLDYKQSEFDNNIDALKKKYQPKFDEKGNQLNKGGGAFTIISKAKNEERVPKRQGQPKINLKGTDWYDPNRPEGSLIYKTADDLYYKKYKKDKNGNTIVEELPRMQKSTKMEETDDARTLISGNKHTMEIVYADYANYMKDLANKARLQLANIENIKMNKSAKETYSEEVKSLNRKLGETQLNPPKEREAQRRANTIVNEKKLANPELTKSEIKKASQIAIEASRIEVGAVSRKKRNIEITDREWEAIQAGAISENKLTKILNNTDIDKLRELATPKGTKEPSKAKINKIQQMRASNYTIEEIAKACGVSPSTVSKYLKGE